MNVSTPVNTIDEALDKLAYVFHHTYGGRDESGRYIIDGKPHIEQEVMLMGNT
jgi:hypothetical protein